MRTARRPPPVSGKLDVALVIPAWNDTEGLARLLDQVAGFGCFGQVVVVDDGSDAPVVPHRSLPDLVVLRHPASRGPGIARNSGLAAVTARHVLFFDADDLLTQDIVFLLEDLASDLQAAARPFDFCLFRYADSRTAAEERWGQPDWDDRLWREAGVSVGVLEELPPAGWPILARTANYPWNKIYRTAFLRDHSIAFGTSRVHEDVAPHWRGFLAAQRILVSNRICAWHHVSRTHSRLTNFAGEDRLAVFAALDEVAATMTAQVSPLWRAAFAEFALGLVDWNHSIIDPALWPQLRAGEQRFVQNRMMGWGRQLAQDHPALWARIAQRSGLQGSAP